MVNQAHVTSSLRHMYVGGRVDNKRVIREINPDLRAARYHDRSRP